SSRRRHTMSDRDWSSDVCSSDLVMFIDKCRHGGTVQQVGENVFGHCGEGGDDLLWPIKPAEIAGISAAGDFGVGDGIEHHDQMQIGRASCRERGENSVVAGSEDS